jgi:calpain
MRVINNVVLLRIRNPWGNDVEWNGAWSDNSREWRQIDDATKKEMGLTFQHDGEFWYVCTLCWPLQQPISHRMSFDDFMRNFEKMEICNLGPEVMDEIEQMTGVTKVNPKLQWKSADFNGSWISGQSAGGCRNFVGA